jgi:hypothetical protein
VRVLHLGLALILVLVVSLAANVVHAACNWVTVDGQMHQICDGYNPPPMYTPPTYTPPPPDPSWQRYQDGLDRQERNRQVNCRSVCTMTGLGGNCISARTVCQ